MCSQVAPAGPSSLHAADGCDGRMEAHDGEGESPRILLRIIKRGGIRPFCKLRSSTYQVEVTLHCYRTVLDLVGSEEPPGRVDSIEWLSSPPVVALELPSSSC